MATADGGRSPLELFAIITYRYLRLSIAVVMLAMLSSIGLELMRTQCLQGSISAYFYSPVRTVFTGGLVAIGVCLIAVKEDKPHKDALLNLAGAMAPVVAFVPTTFSGSTCAASSRGYYLNTRLGIGNNVTAYVFGGVVAVLIGAIVAKVRTKEVGDLEVPDMLVLGAALAMLVGGFIWYHCWKASFLNHAHMVSAIGMFVVVGVVMVCNAFDAGRNLYRRLYLGTAGAMLGGAAVVFLIDWFIIDKWSQKVLFLELTEMVPFLAYWVIQTVQNWDAGIVGAPATTLTPPEQDES